MSELAPTQVFAALGDPTRCAILERLGTGTADTATKLASELGISRQAVAKHLGVLLDAGLATVTRVGREARYAADPSVLGAVDDWTTAMRAQWQTRLQMLADGLGPTPRN